MSEFHIALTGHRPNKLDGYNLNTPYYLNMHRYLVNVIVQLTKVYDVVWVHSGMALGADTVWACAARTAIKKFPGRVKLYAEIPVMTQPDAWFKQEDKDRWHDLVDLASDKTVYAKTYSPRVMQERNIGMIDHADCLLAIWDGTPGGTANAVKYAKSVHKKMTYYAPIEFKV